jgi:hypothetical protein
MSHSRQRRSEGRKGRIERRLRELDRSVQDEPMLRATNVQYDVADRTCALDCGGIGATLCRSRSQPTCNSVCNQEMRVVHMGEAAPRDGGSGTVECRSC